MKRFFGVLGSLALLGLALAVEPASADDPPEFAARHILISWKGATRTAATRTKEEARALAEKALLELHAPGADFAKLSHAYSDDKVSDQQGGFLGIFGPGAMVPAFEKAVMAMKDGETSGIVETDFGFHLIERLSIAQGVALKGSFTAYAVVAVFGYEGTPQGKPTKRSKDQALLDAKKAADLLRAGGRPEDFPTEMDAMPLQRGWQIMPLAKSMVRPEFKAVQETAASIDPGKTSDPIDTPAGFMVLRRIAYFRAHVQHLLVMHAKSSSVPPGITRTKEEAKARAEEALKKIQAEPASWAKIVAEYSDDTSNKAQAGDLHLVEPGAMVREFDEGIASLAPGTVSGLVETQFGYHIIRRQD